MLEVQSLRQSQLSQRMKSKIHVSSWQRVPFAMKSAFLQILNVQRPLEGETPGQHLSARVRVKPESDFHPQLTLGGQAAEAKKWGPQSPLPHTAPAAGGQGTGLPLPEPQDGLLPGLLTFSDQRQGKQARTGMRRLSAFSEFQVHLRCGCVHMCVYILSMHTCGGEGQIWSLGALQHVSNRLRTYLFSF